MDCFNYCAYEFPVPRILAPRKRKGPWINTGTPDRSVAARRARAHPGSVLGQEDIAGPGPDRDQEEVVQVLDRAFCAGPHFRICAFDLKDAFLDR